MRKMTLISLFLVTTALVFGHPHFRKTLTVELPGGVEATVTYQTTVANPERASSAEVGAFLVPRGPRLELSGEISSGGSAVPAGEYTIGVIKNGDADWTMALYPGRLGRGEAPDMAKVIRLDSHLDGSRGTAEHLTIDIGAGSGQFAGKAVLTMHFGDLFLEGALS